MGQVHPSILRGTLGNASKLIRVEDAVSNAIELKPASQHLFDQLPQGVQKHNRPERLGGTIAGLPGFRYDDRQGALEMRRPMANGNARLSDTCEQQYHSG